MSPKRIDTMKAIFSRDHRLGRADIEDMFVYIDELRALNKRWRKLAKGSDPGLAS